jgi:sugar/nucleoside kinase (ribokinase family)
MTKFLKDLLGNDHPLFSANIQELERATGNAGIDTKLIGDITEKAHEIMRTLHLDPADTTGEELYAALRNAVKISQANNILQSSNYILVNLGDGPISLNLQDAVENMHHELSYQNRTVAHAQRHLRMEIVKRYAEHDRTDNEMVHKLTEQIDVKKPEDESHPVIEKNESGDAPYILAIGDIFTDAFIKLSEEVARVDTDEDGSKRLSLPFGSKPPYDEVKIVQAVGPSPNAAVSMSRLGVKAGLMAYLGDDLPGKDSLTYLHTQQVDTETMSVQKDIKSNYYYVLRLGAERTILVKNEKYDYSWQEPKSTPDWIYLSLVSDASWQLHLDMLTYLEAHPDTKLAFQPGTFHFKWGAEKLAAVYARSHIVVMNREEAVDVTGKSYDSLRDLANGLHDMGPKIVVITDGPSGSYASYDGKLVTVPNYPDPAPPFDRTGAGDAFASTIVAALATGESIETALTWAPINSMNVVQKLGAQEGLLTKDKIKELLRDAPVDYKVKEVE